MSYHPFETTAKNYMIKKYPSFIWNKLSSQHHIDLLGIGMLSSTNSQSQFPVLQPTIVLVEVKSTKKPKYYPHADKRCRLQLEAYLKEAIKYRNLGYLVRLVLLVKVNKKIHEIAFNKVSDIPRFIQ